MGFDRERERVCMSGVCNGPNSQGTGAGELNDFRERQRLVLKLLKHSLLMIVCKGLRAQSGQWQLQFRLSDNVA